MNKSIISVLAGSMLVIACSYEAATAPDPPQFDVEAASAPLEFPVNNTFGAFNPCTGLPVTVTLTGTIWFQPHPNNNVVRVKGTTTTSDGYTGSYDETWTGSDNGPGGMSIRTFNTQVTNPSGSRYMVHLVWAIDAGGASWEFLVDRLAPTCITP